MTGSKKKSCFLSAPFGFDASALIHAFAERGVAAARLDDLELGEDPLTGIRREVRRADFVCVVLPGGYRLDDAIFEAGIALGKGRPVLILADPDVDIPFELGQLDYVRTSLGDKQALGGILDAALPGLLERGPRRRAPRRPPSKRLSRADAEGALRALRDPHLVSEAKLLEILRDLFRKVGILDSSPHAHPSDRGPDLAIWIDETQSLFGNPVFVEVKGGRLHQSGIDDAYHSLSHHLIRGKLRLGIIVYWDAEGKKYKVNAANLPLVICLSIEELIDALRLGRFTRTLLAIRNRAVHGVVA